MKLKDILKKVGSGIIRDVVPGGGIILDLISDSTGIKLSKHETGESLSAAIDELPKDKRYLLYEREIDIQDVEIKESNESLRLMLEAEKNSKQTTRPKIAMRSFNVVATITLLTWAGWMVGVYKSPDPLATITSGWPFVATMIGPFVTLLWAYFGVLKREHQTRMNAANGQVSGLGSVIAGLLQGRGK